MQKETEVKHWADQCADEVIAKFGDKKSYVCATGISPSGTVHFGNFRETITTDLVVKALESKGKKVHFVYSWDDYDRFRKVPANIKENMDEFIGMPVSQVKDPFKCHSSYAEHFEKEYEKNLPMVSVRPKFIYQNEKYGNCGYAEDIKFALGNKEKIKTVLDEHRKEPLEKDWLPLTVYCEKCKKDLTKITDYDGKYSITYECECGYKDTVDFRKKGIVKLPWRVDWPMRWNYEKVEFEPAGKEHSTPGGSRTTANIIVKEVWNREPPVHKMYDFIILKGQGGKMSGSLGNVITLREVLEIYEPDIVRYFFAGTRPNTEFFVSFDLDVLKVYEDFDKCERIYFKTEKANEEKDYIKQKRIYELSAIEIPKKQPIQPIFRHLVNLIQIYENDFSKIGEYYKKELKTDFDRERLKQRTERAKNWLDKYALDDYKFKVQEEVKVELNEKEKKALLLLKEKLEKNKYTEQLVSPRGVSS